MGTNYYVRPKDTCPAQCDRWVHLGKSSAGWDFSFRAYPHGYGPDAVTWAVTDYDSWLPLLDLGEIHDEYGKPVSRAEMIAMIEDKRGGESSLYRSDFHDADGYRFTPEWFS